jgi:broad specificity phosphatase PhoE
VLVLRFGVAVGARSQSKIGQLDGLTCGFSLPWPFTTQFEDDDECTDENETCLAAVFAGLLWNSSMADEYQIYLIRHGETEWARNGQHTGRTDIPLTELGREQAEFLRPIFDDVQFEAIISSPLRRSLETAHLAGLKERVTLSDDLREWDYGDYEGITTQQIREMVPDWTVWTHPCPNGEIIEQVATRADRVIANCEQIKGNVALFSHGHFLRVLVSRWIGLGPENGCHFLLGTSTLSILAYEREVRAVKTWNGPLITAACAVPWSRPSVPV